VQRNVKLVALVATAFAAALPAAPALAKSHRVNMKVTKAYPQQGTKLHAIFRGTPFGRCEMRGTLVIPKSIQTWTCKGGSFRVTATGTSGASNDAKGTWVMSKGKGKYKGISGKGTFSGKLSTGVFTYKGKARY